MNNKIVSINSNMQVNKSTIVKIDLSLEQQYAIKKFEKGENLFITGSAGTGKTMLIHHLKSKAKNLGKKIQITALTGCAALLLKCKAKTIHSWSGIKIARGSKSQVITNVMKNKVAVQAWKTTDILVIDEVSMMSQKILEILEEVGRSIRNNTLPFGGIQVIFCGDFYQLPPVGSITEIETCNFCFESPVWNNIFSKENHIELTHIFRQNDPTYIKILQQIRIGELDEESNQILQSFVGRERPIDAIVPIKLFPIRSKVDQINNIMYSKLETEEKMYKYVENTKCVIFLDTGDLIPEPTIKICSKLSVQDIEYTVNQLISNSQIVTELALKIGTLVMCTFNVDIDNGICNGSTGIIESFANTINREPMVRWSNGLITKMEMQWYQSEDFPTIAIGQYPLRLAWAMTIHKIQGANLDMAEIDLGSSIFEFSQTYVGLSRVRSLEGLYLSSFHAHKIKVNPKVKMFYSTIQKKSKEEINEFLQKNNEKKSELDFEEFSYKPENDIKVVKLG